MGNPAIKNRFTGKIIVKASKYASIKEAVEKEPIWREPTWGEPT